MPPLPPGSRIGILGNGQLGQMMAHAAVAMGFRVHVFGPEPDAPASLATPYSTVGEYDDAQAVAAFARAVDVVTYEFENVPLAAVDAVLEAGRAVYPSRAVLATCQHRIAEKQALVAMGVPVADFVAMCTPDDVAKVADAIGFPCILKTAQSGYDGKGQAKVDSATALGEAWQRFGRVACVAEAVVPFEREISVLVARDTAGQVACYDVVENIHRNHILDETIAPAPIAPAVAAEAQMLATRIAQQLELRGLLAVELFVERDGTLRVNELAPRPHNSGHWTMEACATSQFAQCIRAVAGLPLASPARHSNARMQNLIGTAAAAWPEAALTDPTAAVHWYGKTTAAAGRKMGHITWLSPKAD